MTNPHVENWALDWQRDQQTRLAPADRLIVGILAAGDASLGMTIAEIAEIIQGLDLRQWRELGIGGVKHQIKVAVKRLERHGKLVVGYRQRQRVWIIRE